MKMLPVAALLLVAAALAVSSCAPRPETPQQAEDRAKGGQGNVGMGGSGGSGSGY